MGDSHVATKRHRTWQMKTGKIKMKDVKFQFDSSWGKNENLVECCQVTKSELFSLRQQNKKVDWTKGTCKKKNGILSRPMLNGEGNFSGSKAGLVLLGVVMCATWQRLKISLAFTLTLKYLIREDTCCLIFPHGTQTHIPSGTWERNWKRWSQQRVGLCSELLRVVRKPINANLRLKVNRSFHLAL